MLNVNQRSPKFPEGKRNHIFKFRPCKVEDFTSHGMKFEKPEDAQKKIRHRICPDIDKTNPLFELVNGYANE